MLIHSPKELAMAMTWERKKRKQDQKKVADLVGLKQKTISAFENKPEGTKLATLFRILAALDLEIVVQSRKKKSQWKEEW